MGRDARYDAIVRAETAISTSVYALVPTTLLWLAGLPAPTSLPGLMPALALPASVGTFMMTCALTTIIRGRVRRGSLPAIDRPVARGLQRFVPVLLPWRALVLALVAAALFVPGGLTVVALLRVLPLSTRGFVVFNLLYGALLGVVMTPPVVRAALADRLPAIAINRT